MKTPDFQQMRSEIESLQARLAEKDEQIKKLTHNALANMELKSQLLASAASELKLKEALELVRNQEAGMGNFVHYEDVLRYIEKTLSTPPTDLAKAIGEMRRVAAKWNFHNADCNVGFQGRECSCGATELDKALASYDSLMGEKKG